MAESSTESRVKVIVRIRPFLKKQNSQQSDEIGKRCVSVQGTSVVQLQNHKIPNSEIICYKYGNLSQLDAYHLARFDSCYGEQTTQEQIFSSEVDSLLEQLFRGINLTIFAYGVTGAGKTHTMQGSRNDPGIIPRSVSRIFELSKEQQTQHLDSVFSISFAYIELYNENIHDLLSNDKARLDIREDQFGNIVIPGLQNIEINSLEEFQKAYATACKNRTTAATNLNSQSSRSHAILIVSVTKKTKKETSQSSGESILCAKLNLIDLAGSEDNRRTDNKGVRLKESSSINQSLFVLGNVVDALNKSQPRIPYRNSKLTRLLQDSLGGKSNAIMIANIAPAMQFYNDTFNTLNFASKSKKIINNPIVNCHYEQHSLVDNQCVENKRPLESLSFQPSKKSKINDKENVPNLEIQLEQVLEKKGAELLSPFIRKHKILSDPTILQRLENLERQVAVQSAFTSQVTEASPPGPALPKPKSSTFESSKTPTSSIRTAKTKIMKAKEFEEAGNLSAAMELYKQADEMLAYLQENAHSDAEKEKTESQRARLAKKMEKIQRQALMPARKLFDVDEESTTQSTETKENALLRLLNTGSLKELTALKGIGQKRAQKIIEQRVLRPFQHIEDLRTAGFGDKLLASLVENNS